MYKTVSSKFKIFIIVIILIVSLIAIKKLVVDPQPVKDIKMNTVYIGGSGLEYPESDQSRYYVEFKEDGTYILMYDDSRRSQEDYGDDGAGYAQNIIYFFGKYKMENGNYLMKPTNGARVVFKDSASVDRGVISFYKEKTMRRIFVQWVI